MNGQAWTGEDDKLLRELYADGVPWSEIADQLNRSEHAVRCRAYMKMPDLPRRGGRGGKKGSPRIDWTKDEDAKLLAMRDRGCSMVELVETLQRTENAINSRLRTLRAKKPINKKQAATRTCLRCHLPFSSTGPGK